MQYPTECLDSAELERGSVAEDGTFTANVGPAGPEGPAGPQGPEGKEGKEGKSVELQIKRLFVSGTESFKIIHKTAITPRLEVTVKSPVGGAPFLVASRFRADKVKAGNLSCFAGIMIDGKEIELWGKEGGEKGFLSIQAGAGSTVITNFIFYTISSLTTNREEGNGWKFQTSGSGDRFFPTPAEGWGLGFPLGIWVPEGEHKIALGIGAEGSATEGEWTVFERELVVWQ